MGGADDIAWAAGLFEGEGSAWIGRTGNHQPNVSLQMTDEEPVRRFHKAIGCGNVRAYPAYRHQAQPTWQWSAQGRDDVLLVLALLWPWLSPRRQERATEVIERAVKMNDGSGFCKRGHDLSDPRHLYVHQKTGKRQCRTCRSLYSKQRVRGRRGVLRPVASK